MATIEYTGDEVAIELKLDQKCETGSYFEVRSPTIPDNALPVFDDSLNAVVGYCHECTAGVYKLYDVDGNVVGMEETSLESPLVDPTELIFFAGGIIRAAGKGMIGGIFKNGTRYAASASARILAGRLTATILGAMRSTFKGLAVQNLKFTATTAARMTVSGRHVPLHILHLGIKYGKGYPIPKESKAPFNIRRKCCETASNIRLKLLCVKPTGLFCIFFTNSFGITNHISAK